MKLESDDFELFGLPRRFELDRSMLDARWRDLQARVHPDKFVAEGAAAQRIAMQWAVRVNEAYGRLKDPVLRATYLCELSGVSLDAESNTAMPASFLMQQMAWREALDEASGLPQVQELADEVQEQCRQSLRRVQGLLDVQGDAVAAAKEIRALMFIARFERDIDRRLEALGQ